jgi:hypothetical protein
VLVEACVGHLTPGDSVPTYEALNALSDLSTIVAEDPTGRLADALLFFDDREVSGRGGLGSVLCDVDMETRVRDLG